MCVVFGDSFVVIYILLPLFKEESSEKRIENDDLKKGVLNNPCNIQFFFVNLVLKSRVQSPPRDPFYFLFQMFFVNVFLFLLLFFVLNVCKFLNNNLVKVNISI